MKLTELITLYLNNKNCDASLDESLIKLSIEQSLQTLLFPVTNNKEYKKYYVSWIIKQEQFYSIQNEITSLFNENSINHIYFKGSILSKIYDDPAIRTRGDIDLYVGPNDFEKAKETLINNGYEMDNSSEDCMHHIAYKKDGIEVELHFNMLDSNVDKNWLKIFNNPFEVANNVDKSSYEFKPTYHMLFCIMHFADHLRHGAGIRYMMDFYYMFKKTKIDFELLHKLLSDCKLNRLYSNIINELRSLINIDFDSSVVKEGVVFFEDYMLSYGIHGHSNNETSQAASAHKNKGRYLLSRIFMTDKNYRLSRYPRLGKHWYLYPVCIIVHLFYLLTHKMKKGLLFLFGRNKNKNLYKKLGV